jgi:hypothetical protein
MPDTAFWTIRGSISGPRAVGDGAPAARFPGMAPASPRSTRCSRSASAARPLARPPATLGPRLNGVPAGRGADPVKRARARGPRQAAFGPVVVRAIFVGGEGAE